ncbi:MAG: SMC family ATPase [Streptomyces sp.]|uniref:AAA family ATPase n=1 Tax=Streptomyces sp. TaxID=1931 RepID=UPI0025EC3C05|nr:SMC family ATPase [Streptomyces sp.]MBW8801495.1 SMC family ATPase [Streptomyces sp.]
MRPHALSMTGFGPFASTVSLDLDALSSAGLFLLHGATGAGKTTLLDGIGFALFGRVPGVRGQAKRLRSDHCPQDVRTSVTLEASFGARRIRITRSPAWTRPKTRGTGDVTEQGRVLLEELRGGAWETLSTRPREADDEVLDLVGMSAEQFFQVVLLPQGEFAAFLRSSSAERVELLKKLFATERFADVEDWLAGRRRQCGERVGAARAVVDDLAARVAEVASAELADPVSAAWGSSLLAASERALDESSGLVAERERAREIARVAAVGAARLAELQARRRAALVRSETLAAGRPARVAAAVELDAAARAAAVVPVLDAWTARRTARDAALAAVASSCAAELPVEQVRARSAEAVARRHRLDGLRAVDEARRDALAVVGQARAEQADALAEVAQCEVELAVLPTRRAELAAHLSAARSAVAAVPQLQLERDTLAALRPVAVQLAVTTEAVVGLRMSQLGARETALALESKALELRVASTNSMVARLAALLEDGVPCEVCGSPSHPDPSSLRDEGVSVEDEERARQQADEAQAVVLDLTTRLATAVSRESSLVERVGPWTAAALDARIGELDLELDVLLATAAQLEARELDLTMLETRRTELSNLLVAATTRAEAASRRGVEAAETAAALGAELSQAGAADLAAALASAQADAAEWTDALSAAEGLAVAVRELAAAQSDAETACAAAGFADVDAARAAVRERDWCAAQTAALREAADAEAALAAELADPQLAVDLDEPAPVATTAEALSAADAVLAATSAQHGVARQRVEALARLVPALREALEQLAPLEATAREVRALADLCAGGGANGLRMTLTSFVLAARLEEVAAAASVRLLRMTQGRYELVHTDGSARGGARSGLGLLVRDGWSGLDRETATLSGGETFLAALALALGLADVVTAEAGGAHIGALFVDEGFGTLDEETLDEVMDVLDGLREGGRVVGLVSHVAELRQRIPARVEVRKTRDGSGVVVHGC